MTDLSICAKLSGAAFTGNASEGGCNVLTTQYTPPATDLSSYAPKSNPTFTGTVSACCIAASSLSYVHAMVTFTGITSAAFIKNGVYAVVAFTGITSAAFVENGV